MYARASVTVEAKCAQVSGLYLDSRDISLSLSKEEDTFELSFGSAYAAGSSILYGKHCILPFYRQPHC